MKKEDFTAKLEQLIAEIAKAEEEIYRPMEDVVTLSVCYKVRNSISEMLKLYLDKISVKYSNSDNLDHLFSICTANGKEFESVEISKVYCKNENEESCNDKYCLGVNKVAECINVANQLMEVILKKNKEINR